MNVGHDFLGLGSKLWKVRETIKALPAGCAIGCFDNTWPDNFGDPMPNVRKILASGKVSAFRVHIWWAYGNHPLVSLPVLKKALPRWEKLAKDFPNVQVFVSPSCEYHAGATVKTVQACVDAIRKLAPSCIPVLSPWNAPVVPGVITEVHGADCKAKPGQIASYDGGRTVPGKGGAGFDEQIGADKWMSNNREARIAFCWSPRYNLTESHETATANNRDAPPNGPFVQSHNRLMLPKGTPPPPNFSQKVFPWEAPHLYKLFAEDMQGDNLRDNDPLVIVNYGGPFVTLIDRNGKEVAKLTLFEKPFSFPGKLSRYYCGWRGGSNLMGYQVGEKALKQSGSEWVWIKVGGKIYGPINPSFRGPFYQQ